MNHIEAIQSLAQYNARTAHPLRREELPPGIPYFHIYPNQLGKLQVQGYAYETHDNAPRMQLWEQYLQTAILPNLRNKEGVCGYYPIELHDSYTYLQNGKNYKNVFTFSKFKDDAGPVLIPDPYMICNWGDGLQVHDPIQFNFKQDTVCFYGTTTGDRDPRKNRRLQWCQWALDKPAYDFQITHVAQMTVPTILDALGQDTWAKIYRPTKVSREEQMKHRYHLVLDGNTCRFDVWNYKTHCLTFKEESREMLWYYPLLRNREHFVEVHPNTIETHRNYYSNNLGDASRILANAQLFSHEVFKPLTHMMYTTTLLETLAENK